jgi:hypothetical protein
VRQRIIEHHRTCLPVAVGALSRQLGQPDFQVTVRHQPPGAQPGARAPGQITGDQARVTRSRLPGADSGQRVPGREQPA